MPAKMFTKALPVFTTFALLALTATPVFPQDSADAPADSSVGTQSPVLLLRGIDVPVRSRAETGVTEDTRTVSYEAYYDWDFGVVTLVSETGDLAVLPSARSWDFRSGVDPEGQVNFLCFRTDQGDAYLLDGGEWNLVREPESEKPVLGEYDVQFSSDGQALSAVRFDRLSGRSWLLTDDGWEAIPGNLPGWGE